MWHCDHLWGRAYVCLSLGWPHTHSGGTCINSTSKPSFGGEKEMESADFCSGCVWKYHHNNSHEDHQSANLINYMALKLNCIAVWLPVSGHMWWESLASSSSRGQGLSWCTSIIFTSYKEEKKCLVGSVPCGNRNWNINLVRIGIGFFIALWPRKRRWWEWYGRFDE